MALAPPDAVHSLESLRCRRRGTCHRWALSCQGAQWRLHPLEPLQTIPEGTCALPRLSAWKKKTLQFFSLKSMLFYCNFLAFVLFCFRSYGRIPLQATLLGPGGEDPKSFSWQARSPEAYSQPRAGKMLDQNQQILQGMFLKL